MKSVEIVVTDDGEFIVNRKVNGVTIRSDFTTIPYQRSRIMSDAMEGHLGADFDYLNGYEKD